MTSLWHNLQHYCHKIICSNFKLSTLAFILALILTGCKENLYSNLNETDANELLVALLTRGVDAEKQSAGKAGFNILVEKEDLVRALEIAKENSLPRESFASLGSVFAGQGMIASQTEEQARLAYALSQELAASFSKIDGVLTARVHVVLVQHEQSSGVTTPPSAAVFIRHTQNSPVLNMTAAIKETTSKAVPGLSVDRVSLMTELAQETVLSPKLKVQEWYETPLSIVLLTLTPILLMLGIGLGVMYRLGYRFKHQAPQETKDGQESQSLTDLSDNQP